MITTKQRAFLRKMVHDMDPIFQVGKFSVSPELISAIDEALKARELIKLSVLQNCADDPKEIAMKTLKTAMQAKSGCMEEASPDSRSLKIMAQSVAA